MKIRTKDTTAAGCTLAALYFVGLMFVSAIAHGYALAILWGWFVVPLFNLPALSIPQALGLSMVVGLMTKEFSDSGDSTEEKSLTEVLINSTLKALTRPAFALLFGWIVLKFM